MDLPPRKKFDLDDGHQKIDQLHRIFNPFSDDEDGGPQAVLLHRNRNARMPRLVKLGEQRFNSKPENLNALAKKGDGGADLIYYEDELDLDKYDEEEPMSIDTLEDCWTRLNDIAVNGSELFYVGKGRSIHDNGLAQTNIPLNPINHYFEIKILEPGQNCYIAIGVARKDYPLQKHPGWSRGSIAYHADDGKMFLGSGVGSPFGPVAQVNDVLGCGIVFPLHYADPPMPPKLDASVWPWELGEGKKKKIVVNDSDDELRRMIKAIELGGPGYNFGRGAVIYDPAAAPIYLDPPVDRDRGMRLGGFFSDDENEMEEDDLWWNNRENVYKDKVKVFFTRNSKLLGIKEVRIPIGGFYPTIGMMGKNERVLVDLNPLSG